MLARRRQEVLKRLQAILQLGVQHQHGFAKWSSTDFGLQTQALKAISEFIATLPGTRQKGPLEDVLISLTGLMKSANQEVQMKAASVSVTLVSTLESGAQILHAPLAWLVSSSNVRETRISAMVALKIIILKSKTFSAKFHEIMHNVRELGITRALVSVLESTQDDTEAVVASAELLAAILERLPEERYATGSRQTLRRVLYDHCNSGDELRAVASLKALSSFAVCASVGALILEDIAVVMKVSEQWLHSANGKVEVLHFIVCLMNYSSLRSRLEDCDFGSLSRLCVAVLKDCLTENRRCSAEDERLYLLAGNCVSLLLSVPGRHRLPFIKAGLISVLSSGLLPQSQPWPASRKKFRSSLNSYLWESLGWLGYHRDKVEDAILFGEDPGFNDLIGFSCAAFFNDVFHTGTQQYEHVEHSLQEIVQICDALLLLVFSPSHLCSSLAQRSLQRCYKILSPDVNVLCKGSVSACQPAETLVARLHAVSVLCCIPTCNETFARGQVLDSLLGIIRKQCESTDPEWSPLRTCPVPGLSLVKPCCSEGSESWAGRNKVFFASLWAANVMLRNGSVMVKTDFRDLLLKLLSEKDRPQGVRLLAAFGLTRFGLYGFSNKLGKSLGELMMETSLADFRFVFADGSFVLAHRVILAARCPALLASSGQETVRLSSKVTRTAMEKILKFVYTGEVQLKEDELDDVKRLSRLCKLEALRSLLENEAPIWGSIPDAVSLEPASGQFSDIVLRPLQTKSMVSTCTTCDVAEDHVHAHRVVLACTSDYFKALFRSGMRDSFAAVIDVPARKQVLSGYLEFVYTGRMQAPATDCAWKALDKEQQWEVVERMIDLAGLAQEWLEERLREACIEKATAALHSAAAPVLCCRAMQHAAERGQAEIVYSAAELAAPHFLQLRESGALDCLSDELNDLLRTTRLVKLKS